MTSVIDEEERERADDDDEEEEKAIKLTKMLKKALLSHLLNIEEKAVANLSRDNIAMVVSEVEGFAKNMESLVAIRNKTLDVGGVFTRPLREKLETLNNQIITALGENRHIEVTIDRTTGELGALNEIVEALLAGLDDILQGRVTVIGEGLEQLILDSAPESIRIREDRAAAHEQLRADLKRLSALVERDRTNYEEMLAKLSSIALAMSYSTADAWRQGLHIISSLLRVYIRSKVMQMNSGVASVTSSSVCLESDSSDLAVRTGLGESLAMPSELRAQLPPRLERIVMLVIEYLGKDALIYLGAQHLDDLITADLSAALRRYLTTAQVARRVKPYNSDIANRGSSLSGSAGGHRGRTGVSALTGKVEVEKLADTGALPQLVTEADILESRPRTTTPSVQIHTTRRTASTPKSAAMKTTPSATPAAPEDHDGNVFGGSTPPVPARPSMGRSQAGRMKSTFGSGSSMPKKGGATLALISSGDGTVTTFIDGRRSSSLSGESTNSSKITMKTVSNKSMRSSKGTSAASGITQRDSSGTNLVDLTRVSSSTLSGSGQEASEYMSLAAKNIKKPPMLRGRLKDSVAPRENEEESVCTLGSGR